MYSVECTGFEVPGVHDSLVPLHPHLHHLVLESSARQRLLLWSLQEATAKGKGGNPPVEEEVVTKQHHHPWTVSIHCLLLHQLPHYLGLSCDS